MKNNIRLITADDFLETVKTRDVTQGWNNLCAGFFAIEPLFDRIECDFRIFHEGDLRRPEKKNLKRDF